jgi:hypothetical protein
LRRKERIPERSVKSGKMGRMLYRIGENGSESKFTKMPNPKPSAAMEEAYQKIMNS